MKKINAFLIFTLVVTLFSPTLSVLAEEETAPEPQSEVEIQNQEVPEVTIETPAEIEISTEPTTAEVPLELPPQESISSEPTSESTAPTTITATSLSATATTTTHFSKNDGKDSYVVGDTIVVAVILNNSNQSINALSMNIGFTNDMLEVIDVSTGDAVSVWIQQPKYSNDEGTINLEGVITNGIVVGNTIATITFKAKAIGNGGLKFNGGSISDSNGEILNLANYSNNFPITILDQQNISVQMQQIEIGSATVRPNYLTAYSSSTQRTYISDPRPTFFGRANPNTPILLYEKFDHTVVTNGISTTTAIYGSVVSDSNGYFNINPPFNTTDGNLANGDYEFVACEIVNDVCANISADFNLTVDTDLENSNPLYALHITTESASTPIEYNSIVEIAWQSNLARCSWFGHFVKNINGENSINIGNRPPAGSDKIYAATYMVDGELSYTDFLQIGIQCWNDDSSIDINKVINININQPKISQQIYPIITEFSEDTGISSTDKITKDNTPTFTGTASPNVLVELLAVDMCGSLPSNTGCAAMILGQATSDIDGNWIITSKEIPDNTYHIIAQTVLDSGVLDSERIDLTIDTVALEAPVIIEPISGPYAGNSIVKVSGTCNLEADHLNFTFETLANDPFSKIGNNYSYNTPCSPEGTFSTTITLVSQGETFAPFKVGVVQIDDFGNMSPVSNIITFSAPEIITPPSGGGGGGGGGGNSSTPPPTCIILGDINCDQKVNKYDFALMMMAWGFKTKDKADLNTDVSVDKYDFALLMSNWGYGEVKR